MWRTEEDEKEAHGGGILRSDIDSKVSHTACSDEFRRNPRSRSWWFIFISISTYPVVERAFEASDAACNYDTTSDEILDLPAVFFVFLFMGIARRR